jgi:predicted transcriptional regulator
MGNNYRTSNMIIQNLLEILLDDREDEGIVKSHLVELCGLKTSTGDKYLNKMESAGYIQSYEEKWGKERIRIRYTITNLGKTRYEWFVKINNELL